MRKLKNILQKWFEAPKSSSKTSPKKSSIDTDDEESGKEIDEEEYEYKFDSLRAEIEKVLHDPSPAPKKSFSKKSDKKKEKEEEDDFKTENYLKMKKKYEKELLEREEKIKKREMRKKEIEELAEKSTKMKREEEELKDAIEKAKFDADIGKIEKQTELDRLKKEKIKIELRQANINQIFLRLKDAESVDLCFLIDCTGSMNIVINGVKDILHKIVNKLTSRFADLKIRCSFVGYRDHNDGDKRITLLPFTTNIDKFKSFVSGVEAVGHGNADICEDVFGGLEEVTKLDWQYTTKVMFHICDAPCHGLRFHDEKLDDNYPGGDPRGLNLTELLTKITEIGIDYYFAEMNKWTLKMIEEFNAELIEINGKKIEIVQYGKIEFLESTVASSISKSISDSKAKSFHDYDDLKPVEYKLTKLNWSGIGFNKYNANHYVAIKPKAITDVNKSVEYQKRDMVISIANKPFAKGGIRWAFAAYVEDTKTGSVKKYVAKEPIYKGSESSMRKSCEEIAENQIIACYLAEEYFKVSKSTKSIHFIDVSIIHCKDSGKYYCLEEFIEGDFIKWNNNAEYVNEENYAGTVNTFSHWTYQATKEYLVVTDLQGFKKSETEYILTDPAILSPDGLLRFGCTNLGIKGLKKFFERHQCNPICKNLKLKRHKYQVLPDKDKISTDIRS